MTAGAPRGGRRPDGELDPFTLRAAQRGERRAQRRLVDHHARSVFGVLSRILSPAGKGGLVEDLAQETMLRVLGSIERFDPTGPAKLSTWILTIAARLAVQELQRRRPSMLSADAQAVDRLVDGPAASPESHAAARQLRVRVQRVVAEMSAPLRAAFVLADGYGMTPSEVAAALDVPAATARTRIHRARERIRAALDEEEAT